MTYSLVVKARDSKGKRGNFGFKKEKRSRIAFLKEEDCAFLKEEERNAHILLPSPRPGGDFGATQRIIICFLCNATLKACYFDIFQNFLIYSAIYYFMVDPLRYQLRVHAPFKPSGDQPAAIAQLVDGINSGLAHQTLLGVTGSGKTFTLAHMLMDLQRPAIIMAHNKTLAAQLYREFKSFFPNNAVEYFVSYYDYYQPEAYVPASDTFIDKDASVNKHIEQMRLSATKALLERPDTIIVSTVSSIYGLGSPEQYLKMMLHLSVGEIIDQRKIVRRLSELQYKRNDVGFDRGTYRVRGENIDVFPAESDREAIRISLFDDEVESLRFIDPLTGQVIHDLPRCTIYPKTHYVTERQTLLNAIELIEAELAQQLTILRAEHHLVEAQRLEQRCRYDIEMIRELGYCAGIENYSRYLSGRKSGDAPPTLYDYLPKDTLILIDESHVTVPQIGGMYKGDRSRKETLVEYGFRLPSALDNRPLRFEEWEEFSLQRIFISATPGDYEAQNSDQIVEQLVRPTGIVEPEIVIRPASEQVDDLLSEVRVCSEKKQRVLVTTLTKRMAEDLSEYFAEQKIRARYLHSDIETVERVAIIRDLRMAVFDVLIGINLLREGLDIPEVALVAILDADKEGFLRSERSLVQTMGRASRNLHGRVILYADKITNSMQRAIDETDRRRACQTAFNKQHNITPRQIEKPIDDMLDIGQSYNGAATNTATAATNYNKMTDVQIHQEITKLEEKMHHAAQQLEFEQASWYRDQIHILKQRFVAVS